MLISLKNVFKPHIHTRWEWALFSHIIGKTAPRCSHFIAQPNPLGHLITDMDRTEEYQEMHDRVLELRGITDCNALMSFYLTEETPPLVIEEVFEAGAAVEIKVYPRGSKGGGTTGAHAGVRNVRLIREQLGCAEAIGMPIKFHGTRVERDNGDPLDPFDEEEQFFMLNDFPWVRRNFPRLKIVLAHVSTKEGVEAIQGDESGLTWGEFAPQHILANRLHMCRPEDGVNTTYTYRPLPQTQANMWACLDFATSGDPRAMIGSDCAAHYVEIGKSQPFRAACGMYMGGNELLWYATAHSVADRKWGGNRMDNLQPFVSRPYGIYTVAGDEIPKNGKTIDLAEEEWTVDSLEEVPDTGKHLCAFGYHPDPQFRIPCEFTFAT